ncbi:MAG: hypothetical protein EHM24_13925 [Acidobacteria bacterium]|nr:MAG: hypothetical protein EHM24_13925 [Acidobacteriota bacterium]
MDQSLGETRRETWSALDRGRRPDVDLDVVNRMEPRTSAIYKVGDWIEHLGRRLRGDALTQRVAAADGVGRALERAGEYLEHRQMADIRNDAERLIVRRPVMTLAVALVAGYAAGRIIWR